MGFHPVQLPRVRSRSDYHNSWREHHQTLRDRGMELQIGEVPEQIVQLDESVSAWRPDGGEWTVVEFE
jgi:hypothetical protein